MMVKTNLLLVAAFWLLTGWQIAQVTSSTYELKYKPEVFDDQYIGCPDELSDDIMPRILSQEKSNQQLNDAWNNATKQWKKIKSGLKLPNGFKDEHGIALLVFSNQYPKGNPIHQQFNGNLSAAGASRKAYMDRFHFKALHFYLTRALQMLKPDCKKTYTTYRGSHDTFWVSPIFKFGRFTSTSLEPKEALTFGITSLFNITTCFGASIGDFSFFPDEHEVLIPPTEKFRYVKKESLTFILESTGQMCSYFNCTIMGAEKQADAVCYPDPSMKSKTIAASTSPAEQEERIAALEDFISKNHGNWDASTPPELITKLNAIVSSNLEVGKGIEALKSTIAETKKSKEDNINTLSLHLILLHNKVKAQEAFISQLELIVFTVIAAVGVYFLVKKFCTRAVTNTGRE